jgi:hemolysin activation/secretion protein
MCLPVSDAAEEEGAAVFEIRGFELTGYSIFPEKKLQETVSPFTGAGRTAADVEKARDALEKLYHQAGYPAVLVNIPEQTVETGVVKLQVIESRIGRVKVSGNRHFTTEKIMRGLPSFHPGEILYLPRVQQEIGRLNRNPDFKVEPVMAPGKEPGTVDVELKVEDRLPLHGSLDLNNRASHDTEDLRLNAMLRYDNLWQREHSISLQYQTAPQEPSQVQAVSGSYVLPAPWERDHLLALYGIWSDSDTAFGEGFNVVGKGVIFGTRYIVPLPPYKLYAHNITLGLDYKDFKESLGLTSALAGSTRTPITYMPFSVSYSASLPDEWGGLTQFSGGVNVSFRDLVSDQREFEMKRFKARANYLYATAGVQRTQTLPWGLGLFIKADGQVADQPLISNEQYTAGGMESVRGYKESEALGDHAIHGTIELSFPDPLKKMGMGDKRFGKVFQMNPYLFCDYARLTVKDPLPGQDEVVRLGGAGVGVRGSLTRNLEYEVDWAVALNKTDRTDKHDQRVYFTIKALF